MLIKILIGNEIKQTEAKPKMTCNQQESLKSGFWCYHQREDKTLCTLAYVGNVYYENTHFRPRADGYIVGSVTVKVPVACRLCYNYVVLHDDSTCTFEHFVSSGEWMEKGSLRRLPEHQTVSSKGIFSSLLINKQIKPVLNCEKNCCIIFNKIPKNRLQNN